MGLRYCNFVDHIREVKKLILNRTQMNVKKNDELSAGKRLLAKRILYTLIASKMIYLITDLFFANQKMTLMIVVALFFDSLVASNLAKAYIKERIFLTVVVNSVFQSFLCYYFSLDLHFIPAFCILFIITTIIFDGITRFALHVFTVLNITLILILYKGNYQFLVSHETEIFVGSLRLLYYISIITISFFILDFYKHKSIEREQKRASYHLELRGDVGIGTEDNAYATKDLQSIFESIERKDNSFMAVFLSEFPEFVDKVLALNPKINEKELEICALIKLGLTTKEIAIATNSTYKSIEAKKYRIRKKLAMDSSVNLVLFFNSI